MIKTKFRVLFLLMMSLGAGGSAIAQLQMNITPPDTLKAGETLKDQWGYLQSKNRFYLLSLQYGDLYLDKYVKKGKDYVKTTLWQTRNPDGSKSKIAAMQTDGNFVLYNSKGQAVWNTKTNGPSNHNCYLVLQDDGNLVIYKPNGVALWNTKTNGK